MSTGGVGLRERPPGPTHPVRTEDPVRSTRVGLPPRRRSHRPRRRALTVAEPRALRVVQISDTHLSPRRAYAVPNVRATLAWLAADPPDLVVHTGDVTADDPDDAEEADFARQLLTADGLPLVVLPGNHDVGGFSGDRFSAERLATHQARWGPDGWVVELGPWRLVGADVYRLAEADHLGWVRAALSTDRPVALFLHQPICLTDPDRPDTGDWSVPFPQRRGLLDAMAGRPVRVVASGHLHRYRAGALPDGTSTVWAPAASFTGTIRDDGSTYVVGAVEHLLAADGTATHRLVQPPGVELLHFPDLVPKGSEGLRDAPPLPLEALPTARPHPARGTVQQ
jgi:3',5'-cyclic AMP phosphodiesterase CpdA